MILSEEAKGHLETLQWLLDGPRRSGRTTLICLALLGSAFRNLGSRVYIFDHINQPSVLRHTMDALEGLFWKEFNTEHMYLTLNRQDRYLVIDYKAHIPKGES